jgi:hypothetical protein
VCAIALGAVWVVLNPAPVAPPKKEAPVKRSLAYEQAISQPREAPAEKDEDAKPAEADAKPAEADIPAFETVTSETPDESGDPSNIEDILANDGASQDPDAQDMAALPDEAAGAQPHPWHTDGAGQWGDERRQADPFADQREAYGQSPNGEYTRNDDQYWQQGDPYREDEVYDPNSPDPFAAQDDPYASQRDPYAGQRQVYGGQGDPSQPRVYGGQSDPSQPRAYGGQADPYAGQRQAYGGQGDPYAAQQDPYAAQRDPYGQPQQGAQWADPNAEQWVQVIISGAPMRATASEEAPMLFAFPYGRSLKVVSRNDSWVEVTDPKSAATGWMQAHVVAPSSAPGQQPYAQNEAYYEEQQPKEKRGIFGGGGFADMINRALGGGGN